MLKNVLLYKEKNKLLRNSVEQVILNVNHTCFFKCQMCSSWKIQAVPELEIDVYKKFFIDLKKLNGPDTLIQITGGEPLINKNIYDIVKLSKSNGFITGLNTNGWLLNEINIKKLIESGIDIVVLSLDGSCPEVHDKIRGMPGSYKRIMKALKLIKDISEKKEKEVSITINTVISALNLHDILKIVSLIEKTPYVDNIWFQVITAPLYEKGIDNDIITDKSNDNGLYWYESEKYSHLWSQNKEQLFRVFSQLCLLSKKSKKISNNVDRFMMQYNYFLHPKIRIKNSICTMFKDLIVESNGDVFHCAVKRELLGNITEHSISQLWNSYEGLKLRKNVLKCKKHCHILLNCGLPKDIRERSWW